MDDGSRPDGTEGAKGETKRVELDRTQQTLARRMAESKATVPHVHFRTDVDMSRAVRVQAAFAQDSGRRRAGSLTR